MTARRPAASPSPSAEHRLLDSLLPMLNFRASRRYPAGIGDDAAIRCCRGPERLVLTADTCVEGVHFSPAYMTLAEAGYKAMVANLSDCAAMGARPESALVNLVFPRAGRGVESAMRSIYRGFYRACRRWDFPIVGGDLSGGPCWMMAIAMVGRLEAGARPLRRGGARHGDILWMTGRPGMAAAGLAALRRWGRTAARGAFKTFVNKQLRPSPRLRAGAALAAHPAAHAAMDCSDGISKDAATLGYESGLGVVLEGEALRPGPAMRRLASLLKDDPWEWVLHGGEDYELLAAAAPGLEVRRLLAPLGVPCAAIGRFERGRQGLWIRANGAVRAVGMRAWDHLR